MDFPNRFSESGGFFNFLQVAGPPLHNGFSHLAGAENAFPQELFASVVVSYEPMGAQLGS